LGRDPTPWLTITISRTSPPPDDNEPPKPAVVELPSRTYSLLGSILAVVAFIAVLILLRR
jgi:hypothetical protein